MDIKVDNDLDMRWLENVPWVWEWSYNYVMKMRLMILDVKQIKLCVRLHDIFEGLDTSVIDGVDPGVRREEWVGNWWTCFVSRFQGPLRF